MTATSKAPSPAGLTAEEERAQRYDRLLGALADRVVDDAIGTRIPAGTRLPDGPQSRLWLGMLSSEPQLVADQLSGRGYRGKLIPPAQGFSFRVAALPVSLDVTVSAAYYLALHPTVDEQLHLVNADCASQSSPALADAQGAQPAARQGAPGRPDSQQGYRLATVWTKCVIEPVLLTVGISAADLGSRRVGVDGLTAALAAAGQVPPGSQLFRCRRPYGPPGSLPRHDDLLDATAWSQYAAINLLSSDAVRPPTFSAALQVDVAVAEVGYEILLTVVNTTPAIDDQLIDGQHTFDKDCFDPLLYEVTLNASADTPLKPYELEQVAQSYRYHRTVPAFGHAGAVRVSREHDPLDAVGRRTADDARGHSRDIHWRRWQRMAHRHQLRSALQRPCRSSFSAGQRAPRMGGAGVVEGGSRQAEGRARLGRRGTQGR